MSQPAAGMVPWAPEELGVPAAELTGWSYVVLEEIVDRVALLRRWGWPLADAAGRLVWPDGSEHDTQAVTVDVELLRAQLYTASDLQRRPRAGDTFAAPGVGPGWAEGSVDDVRTLFAGPVYDISAEARNAAQLAYQAGLTRVRPLATAEPDSRAQVRATFEQRTRVRATTLSVAAPPGPDGDRAPAGGQP